MFVQLHQLSNLLDGIAARTQLENQQLPRLEELLGRSHARWAGTGGVDAHSLLSPAPRACRVDKRCTRSIQENHARWERTIRTGLRLLMGLPEAPTQPAWHANWRVQSVPGRGGVP